MQILEKYPFARIVSLILLLAASFWIYSSAWRLPIGDVSFTALATDPSGLPFSKSELVIAALSVIFAAYLSVIFIRSWIVFGAMTILALVTSTVALGHRYPLTTLGAGPDLVSTILGPVIGINMEQDLKVLAAPDSTAQAIEILTLQAPIVLTGKERGWYRAAVRGGRVGWVPAEKIVIP